MAHMQTSTYNTQRHYTAYPIFAVESYSDYCIDVRRKVEELELFASQVVHSFDRFESLLLTLETYLKWARLDEDRELRLKQTISIEDQMAHPRYFVSKVASDYGHNLSLSNYELLKAIIKTIDLVSSELDKRMMELVPKRLYGKKEQA